MTIYDHVTIIYDLFSGFYFLIKRNPFPSVLWDQGSASRTLYCPTPGKSSLSEGGREGGREADDGMGRRAGRRLRRRLPPTTTDRQAALREDDLLAVDSPSAFE